MLKIVKIDKKSEWDGFVGAHGHPLQMWGWGELKTDGTSWKVHRIFIKNEGEKRRKKEKYSDVQAAAQILVRKLPWPLRNFAYIPRGAVILSKKPQERAKILKLIAEYCRKEIHPRPVAISIEPDWDFDENLVAELTKNGWKKAENTVLIPRTLILDLNQSEEELLAKMSKKTRQYIRKSGVEVSVREISTDQEISQAIEIYKQTAKRAGFAIHNENYYHNLKKKMGENSPIFAAFIKKETQQEEQGESSNFDFKNLYKNQEMVAFLWLAKSEKTSFELYGGVNDLGQKVRANYALKWLTILQMKNTGVERYDFNGLLNDGISKFKAGFSNHENQLLGTFDKPLSGWYFLWSKGLPTFKKIVRKFKK